jgi:DNA-binding beta-propeller fold protein YncE
VNVKQIPGHGARFRSANLTAGREAIRPLGLALVVAALLLALTAAPAFAARGHVESAQVIGKPCTELVCGEEELKEPSAVAVNEATNRVYVLDQGDARVLIFNAETSAQVGEFDGTATPAGSFEFPAEPQTGALAVDNSCALHQPLPLTGPECEAFDPSAGDVYVADSGSAHRVVDKFSAGGEYLGQINEAAGHPFAEEALDGVAVDPSGTLWVYREHPEADGFSNAATNVFTARIVFSFPAGNDFGQPGFAVDSAGDFYGKLAVNAIQRIVEWNHAGTVVNEKLGGIDGPNAVSVEQTSDSSFLGTDHALTTFGPEGTELERFAFAGAPLTKGAGIGVDATSGFAYLADSAAGQLRVLAPRPPGPPLIEAAHSVSEVTNSIATIGGEINPRSEPGEAETTYRFEYGPCATPTTCALSPFPFRTPDGTLPADFAPHPVSATLEGLQPGTAYHFRLSAENSLSPEPTPGHREPTIGPEATFTTQATGTLSLPDSRQWQLVSPAQKLGAKIEPIIEAGVVEAAADGAGITYLASTPTEAEPQGNSNLNQILSGRSASGWSARDIAIPHAGTTGFAVGNGPEYKFFSPDLSAGAVQPFGEFNPALSPEASEATPFLHDLGTSCGSLCFTALVTAANAPGAVFGEEGECRPGTTSAKVVCGPILLGASEDLGHVVMNADAALTPGADPGGGLFEWGAGALSPISVLPNGSAANGALGLGNQATRGAISPHGSRIDWSTTTAGAEALYLRANATAPQSASGACDEAGMACTIQLDAAEEGCITCEGGGGVFQFMNSDGSRAFFTDSRRLIAESGAESHKPDLYECRIAESSPGHLACRLTDLTPETAGEGAAVQGGILGASADGSTLYFVAEAPLAANSVENGAGPQQAQPGHPNLYRLRDGAVTFISTLSDEDQHDWREVLAEQPTRVSPDGRYLEFMSQAPITGYENSDRATGEPVAEVFLYDSQTGWLRCASCDPTGARPVGVEYLKLEPGRGGLVGGGRDIWGRKQLVAANVPGWGEIATGVPAHMTHYQDRYLLNSGRLFFNTINPLVPQDSNGNQDVYEYEPPNIGNCTEASPTFSATSGGCVNLISSGSSPGESAFLDASENGDDVFFLTAARLAKADTDAQLDVYDAHSCEVAEGCLTEPAAAPLPCGGEACQAPGAVPVEVAPESQNFAGPGNPAPSRKQSCPKGKTKKGGKCVKKQTKHHKKKAQKSGRAAGKSQGGSK